MEKAGEDLAPNFSRFRDSLKEATSSIQSLAGHRLEIPEEAADTEDNAAEDATASSGTEAASAPRGAISTRADALEQLEKVAQWFERHEPQSILISEIRKVRKRAMMSTEELYRDLIDDSSVRERLFRDIGIETTSEDESS